MSNIKQEPFDKIFLWKSESCALNKFVPPVYTYQVGHGIAHAPPPVPPVVALNLSRNLKGRVTYVL